MCTTPLATPQEGPVVYPAWPQSGTSYFDLYFANFVDLDPGPGLLDWDCTKITYDGHQGVDSSIHSFGEQDIGVPVFAALDGTVADVHDGEPDHNTSGAKVPSNYVVLYHRGSQYSVYVHFRKDSIAVGKGQKVAAGTQLGLTASSGYSRWPHLHLESWNGGEVYEPSAGPCRPGDSYWTHQIPIRRDMFLWDFNVSSALIEEFPGLPWDMPRAGTFAVGKRALSFWIQFMNLPASSSWRVQYLKPDGTLALEDAGTFENPFWLGAWWWWRFGVDLDVAGPWRIILDINGVPIMDAPFDVVNSPDDIRNRPPNPVQAFFEPALPREGDLLFCRVMPGKLPGDPDYDIVRYRYQWSVGDTPIRDAISAGTSDAIPRNLLRAGDLLECRVTPGDGKILGEAAIIAARVRNAISLAATSSASPRKGVAPLAVSFAASAWGGTEPYAFAWDFGDGSTASYPEAVHTFFTPGVFNVRLAVTDALGDHVEADTLRIEASPPPPVVATIFARRSPLTLIVEGSNFQEGILVAIGSVPWPRVQRKSSARVIVRGGRELNKAVPKGKPAALTFTNPDGGSVTLTWQR